VGGRCSVRGKRLPKVPEMIGSVTKPCQKKGKKRGNAVKVQRKSNSGGKYLSKKRGLLSWGQAEKAVGSRKSVDPTIGSEEGKVSGGKPANVANSGFTGKKDKDTERSTKAHVVVTRGG